MRILLTGGVGFIGQQLARRLAAQRHELVALDNLHPQVHADPAAARARFPGEVWVGDVAEAATWQRLPQVDSIVHLAAETGTGQSMYEVDRYRRVNVSGTEFAAEFARRRAVPLVLVSSRAVYGEGSPTQASLESDPHQPTSIYGHTKSEAEAAASARLPEGLTILRPQNVIGVGQSLHNPYTGVLAAWLAMAKEQRPLTIYGDGLATRDFVSVADVAAVLEFFVGRPAQTCQVFNVGSGQPMSMLAVARTVLAATPWPDLGVTHLDVQRRGDITHAWADLTQLGQAGAPVPQTSPAAAITAFITQSWDEIGADAAAWEHALAELAKRGLTTSARHPQPSHQDQ